MKYGRPCAIKEFSDEAMSMVDEVTNSKEIEWEKGTIFPASVDKRNEIMPDWWPLKEPPPRNSTIAWLKDRKFRDMLLEIAQEVNEAADWNLNITDLEPVQYGIYEEGGYFNWHTDQHPQPNVGMVRKISMSLQLNEVNEDFEGGELDLELFRPEVEPRYQTYQLEPRKAIFFKSDTWHRVRPVTSGIRKSLVAWFIGPPYV